MKISQIMQDAINAQINREFQNEVNYLAMKVWFDKMNWNGFSHWFLIQTQEERSHALKFCEYITDRNGTVVLDPLEAPKYGTFLTHLETMEKSIELEYDTTKHINNLMALAIKENDFATVELLQWYVKEQVEEENSFLELITKTKVAETDKSALLLLDEELLNREFKPPVK